MTVISTITTIIRKQLVLLALLPVVTACYKIPMEDIKATHQYSAKELIQEWRDYSARKPLPLVHNDDYYAPYTPPVRNRNTQSFSSSSDAYYYDPSVDNPQPRAPYIADLDAQPYQPAMNGNVTNELLYAY